MSIDVLALCNFFIIPIWLEFSEINMILHTCLCEFWNSVGVISTEQMKFYKTSSLLVSSFTIFQVQSRHSAHISIFRTGRHVIRLMVPNLVIDRYITIFIIFNTINIFTCVCHWDNSICVYWFHLCARLQVLYMNPGKNLFCSTALSTPVP